MPGIGVLRVSEAERSAVYPCDRYVPPPTSALFRAIDVDASPEMLFRWLCQLRAAPYSYDLLDNRGRRSPRELTPGLDRLAVGDTFILGPIVEFEPGVHITCRTTPKQARLYGDVAVSYAIRPTGERSCRLVIKGVMAAGSRFARLRARLLSIGDVPMMRKQLLTLKGLAERDERRLRGEPAGA